MQIKKKFKNVLQIIRRISAESQLNTFQLKHSAKKSDDIYALSILQPLLNNQPYLPFNGGALRPICMAYILNEIIINQREKIIEFGSGLSTILMARLIKLNNLDAKIISIEHNKPWVSLLTAYLKNEGLQDIVQIFHAELKETESPVGNVDWYNLDAILNKFTGIQFDLMIIDGPPANGGKIKHSRFPALLKMSHHLAKDYCVLIDDANRKGEQDMIAYYKQNHPQLSYVLISETLGVFRSVTDFNPVPIYY